MTIEIIPANRFTVQELADLYNQTRVDYLVPMPMNADRLNGYIHDFDVDLHHSCVARVIDGQVLGLSMLGFRREIAWITRLGVLPSSRRTGTGSALMDRMLENAEKRGAKETHLEVIKDNDPAYKLFLKRGFVKKDTYLVMRHAPRPIADTLQGKAMWLDYEKALEKLATHPRHLTWINAYDSMRNASDTEGLQVTLPEGGSGWLIYRNTKFTLRSTLSHLIIHTEYGEPNDVGTSLLRHLHTRFPHHDTYAENIHENDPHLSVFHKLGYFNNFSRVEMRR